MNISHNGLGELVTTFAVDGKADIKAGTLIKLIHGEATPAETGDAFIGVAADDSRNGKIAVQVGGYVKTKYTGMADYGLQYVVVDNDNSVEFCSASTENAIPVKALFIDSSNGIAGFIM